MAAKTFTYAGVDHNWNTPGNWNLGTLPVDNDSVTIPANETCVFNANMSATGTWPNGIDTLTINGTLNCTDVAGSYYLKIKGTRTITGTGTLNWGSTVFAAKHTLTGNASWYINGSSGLTFLCVGAEPTTKIVYLVNSESIGATRLEIDTNLTGDIWAINDEVHVGNVNQSTAQSEARTIQDIQPTYIDITVGLTAAKSAGGTIVLVTRNTQIIGNGNGVSIIKTFSTAGKCTWAGGEFTFTGGTALRPFESINYLVISGGAFHECNNIVYGSTFITISGGVFTGVGTGTTVGNTCTNFRITGGIFVAIQAIINSVQFVIVTGGLIIGCGSPFYMVPDLIILGGTFIGNSVVVIYSSGKITGATFTNNNYPIRKFSGALYNQPIPYITTEYLAYSEMAQEAYAEAFDYNGIAGDYKAWTQGGVTTNVESPVPSGFTKAYQTALESASLYGWWRRKVLVPAGKTVSFVFYIRKSVSMSYKPRAWVFLDSAEPFISGTPLKEFIFPDDDNDTWETDTYSYTNTDNYDKTLIVRFLGKNASGNVYTQLAVNHGMAARSRVLGGVG